MKSRFSTLFIGAALALVPAYSTTITNYSNAANRQDAPRVKQPALSFWGLSSDQSIASRAPTFNGALDDSSTHNLIPEDAVPKGPPFSEAPEAGTYLLIGSGLIGLVLLSKLTNPRTTDPRRKSES